MNKNFKINEILSSEEVQAYQRELDKESYYSRYVQRESVAIFTFRKLDIIDESLEISSQHFIFKNNNIYSYNIGSDEISLIGNGHQAILDYLVNVIEKNTEILDAYYDQIEELEDAIYDQNLPRHYIEMWFDLKKSILKIERYHTRAILALEDFQAAYQDHKVFDNGVLDHLKDKMQNNFSQASSLVAKLDTIYNYYTSVKNERLNKNIYLLTLLSGIFLPLNLIVGFFGMNTENLFFKDQPKGTIYVFSILVGVFLFFTIGYKVLQIFDRFLLRYGLGNYKLYKVVSDKLQKIDNVMDTN